MLFQRRRDDAAAEFLDVVISIASRCYSNLGSTDASTEYWRSRDLYSVTMLFQLQLAPVARPFAVMS